MPFYHFFLYQKKKKQRKNIILYLQKGCYHILEYILQTNFIT